MNDFAQSPSLTLLPAVDVAGGKAVRLTQGEAGTETNNGDPRDAAAEDQRPLVLHEQFEVLRRVLDLRKVELNPAQRAGIFTGFAAADTAVLANSTGGTVFRNSNDISAEFDRLVVRKPFAGGVVVEGRALHPRGSAGVDAPAVAVHRRVLAGQRAIGAQQSEHHIAKAGSLTIDSVSATSLVGSLSNVVFQRVGMTAEGDPSDTPTGG